MHISYWCVLIAALLPFGFTAIAKTMDRRRFNNHAVREFQAQMTGVAQRTPEAWTAAILAELEQSPSRLGAKERAALMQRVGLTSTASAMVWKYSSRSRAIFRWLFCEATKRSRNDEPIAPASTMKLQTLIAATPMVEISMECSSSGAMPEG